MSEHVHPALEGDTATAAYWRSLADGELRYQQCELCGNAQLPPRNRCVQCLQASLVWQRAVGRGHIVSWMVYHYAIRPQFKERIPYNVAIVELAEGPRLITNIVGVDNSDLWIGMPVELAIENEDGLALARFRPSIADHRAGGTLSTHPGA